MREPHMESPFNALPPVVTVMSLVLFGVECVLQLANRGIVGGAEGVGWRSALATEVAVVPSLFHTMWAQNLWSLEHILRLVTYPIVHADFTHMLFAVVFILALGKLVGEIFSAWAVLVVFFGATVAGAVLYVLLVAENFPLFGAFPGAYGLIGAYTFLMWVHLTNTGGQPTQAFYLIAFLMGIQLLFGLLFGGGFDWIADLAGFAAGFVLSFLVSPGGWARVMAKLRQR